MSEIKKYKTPNKNLRNISIERLVQECGCSTIQAMLIESKFGTPRLVPSEEELMEIIKRSRFEPGINSENYMIIYPEHLITAIRTLLEGKE